MYTSVLRQRGGRGNIVRELSVVGCSTVQWRFSGDGSGTMHDDRYTVSPLLTKAYVNAAHPICLGCMGGRCSPLQVPPPSGCCSPPSPLRTSGLGVYVVSPLRLFACCRHHLASLRDSYSHTPLRVDQAATPCDLGVFWAIAALSIPVYHAALTVTNE